MCGRCLFPLLSQLHQCLIPRAGVCWPAHTTETWTASAAPMVSENGRIPIRMAQWPSLIQKRMNKSDKPSIFLGE